MPICRCCKKSFDGRAQAKFCTTVCAFWSGVRLEDIDDKGCWPWQKRVDTSGYPRMRFVGIEYPAHRMSYALALGEDVFGTIYNECGQRRCVNPKHWRL